MGNDLQKNIHHISDHNILYDSEPLEEYVQIGVGP